MDFHNTTIFERNTVMDVGGALLIEAFGQLRVFPQTSILFERNSGRSVKFIYKVIFVCIICNSIGSAIFVRSQTTSVVYTHLAHNPQCFLLYADQDVPLVHLSKVGYYSY